MENTEKDRALHLRIQHLHWIRPSHLDITVPDLEKSAQFELATEGTKAESASVVVMRFIIELGRINSFKAPRDKLVCIFNCCKVVYSTLNAFRVSDNNFA